MGPSRPLCFLPQLVSFFLFLFIYLLSLPFSTLGLSSKVDLAGMGMLSRLDGKSNFLVHNFSRFG
jgi:hypothetical protein